MITILYNYIKLVRDNKKKCPRYGDRELEENNDKLNDKIKEGNEIEIKFDEIKNERNILIEQLFGNTNKNIVLENNQ